MVEAGGKLGAGSFFLHPESTNINPKNVIRIIKDPIILFINDVFRLNISI
jgi:hypothetical protein